MSVTELKLPEWYLNFIEDLFILLRGFPKKTELACLLHELGEMAGAPDSLALNNRINDVITDDKIRDALLGIVNHYEREKILSIREDDYKLLRCLCIFIRFFEKVK